MIIKSSDPESSSPTLDCGRKDKGKEKQTDDAVCHEEVNPTIPPSNPYIPPVPFPNRLNKSKWDKSFSDIYKILSKVNVNLPLLDMIRNMPAYLKFFKELNTRKRKYEPHEKVMISETVSAVLQCKLPPKLKDPGSFIINITVVNKKEEKTMLDLGASINLMPYSIYQ